MNILLQIVFDERLNDLEQCVSFLHKLIPACEKTLQVLWTKPDGKTVRQPISAASEIVTPNMRFIELGIDSVQPFSIGVEVESALGVLKVFPTSAWWAGPEYFDRTQGREASQLRLMAKQIESSVQLVRPPSCPSCLELTLICGNIRENSQLPEFFEALAASLAKTATAAVIYCTVDIGGPDLFTRMRAWNPVASDLLLDRFLAASPHSVDQLGRKIDRLHRGICVCKETGELIVDALKDVVIGCYYSGEGRILLHIDELKAAKKINLIKDTLVIANTSLPK